MIEFKKVAEMDPSNATAHCFSSDVSSAVKENLRVRFC